jgi:hypothetical protein
MRWVSLLKVFGCRRRARLAGRIRRPASGNLQGRKPREGLVQIVRGRQGYACPRDHRDHDRASDCHGFPPTFNRYNDMGDPMCGMIARNGGWHRERARDCCANGRGPERPKGDPSSKQNNNAHNCRLQLLRQGRVASATLDGCVHSAAGLLIAAIGRPEIGIQLSSA